MDRPSRQRVVFRCALCSVALLRTTDNGKRTAELRRAAEALAESGREEHEKKHGHLLVLEEERADA